jgi:hypothetical protein
MLFFIELVSDSFIVLGDFNPPFGDSLVRYTPSLGEGCLSTDHLTVFGDSIYGKAILLIIETLASMMERWFQ